MNKVEVPAYRIAPITFLSTATVFAVMSFLFVQMWDGDIFWQVGIGRYILSSGLVPQTDLFSLSGYGRPYHDSHWLFQIVMASADSLLGMYGVHMVMILLWGLIFYVCYRAMRTWCDAPLALIVLAVTMLACSGRFTPRPDVLSFFMVMAYYYRLQQVRYRTLPDQLFLTGMQVIWTNVHGLFVIGPFMVGCYLLSALIEGRGRISRDVKDLGGLLLAVSASTVLTPFGVQGWSYAYLLFKEGGPNSNIFFQGIEELKSPFQPHMLRYPDVWIFVLFLIATAVSAFRARRGIVYSRLLLVFVFALMAANSVRNVPFLVLTAAPFFVENLNRLSVAVRMRSRMIILAGAVMLLMALAPLTGAYYRWQNIPVRFGLGVSPSVFPSRLPFFLRKINFTGPLYNSVDLGGFCLYHGFIPLFDSRWEVFLPDLLKELWVAPYEQTTWQALDDRFRFEGLLLQHGTHAANALIPRLMPAPEWKLVYIDNVASFWIRESARWNHVEKIDFRPKPSM